MQKLPFVPESELTAQERLLLEQADGDMDLTDIYEMRQRGPGSYVSDQVSGEHLNNGVIPPRKQGRLFAQWIARYKPATDFYIRVTDPYEGLRPPQQFSEVLDRDDAMAKTHQRVMFYIAPTEEAFKEAQTISRWISRNVEVYLPTSRNYEKHVQGLERLRTKLEDAGYNL